MHVYLTLVQLADSFGVEQNTVKGWLRHEGLPYISERGRWLFDRAEVIAWAAQRGIFARAGFFTTAWPYLRSGLPLTAMVRAGGIWRDVAAAEVVEVLATVVPRLPGATPPIRQLLVVRARATGGISWVPVGGGTALAHLRSPVTLGRDAGICAVLLLREALPCAGAGADGVPVTRLLFFIAPSPRTHLEFLGEFSTALIHGALGRRLASGAPDAEILAALAEMTSAAEGKVAEARA